MRRTALILVGFCVAGAAGAGIQPGGAETRDIRAFRPSTNGFAFVNHFTGSPIPFSLGGLENKIGAPSAFGLCGGMSFAAADLYLAGRTPPVRETPPSKQDGTVLFDYIQGRQMATFGPGMWLAARFGKWMSLPDDGLLGTRTMTIGELDDVRAGLCAGKPIVLGLVFNHHANNLDASGPAGVPWENHQVLAYDMAQTSGGTSIRIYDPNYPKQDDVAINCRAVITGTMLAGPWGGVEAPMLGVACERAVGKSRARPVRGVFVMPYTESRVPEKLE